MSRLIAALLIAVAAQACLASAGLVGRAASESHVAERGQFPHQAWLQITTKSGDRDRHCAGALINTTWVITTASCVQGSNMLERAVGVNVFLGTFYLPIETRDYYMYYGYSSDIVLNEANDLALIGLNASSQTNDYVASIRLPPKSFATASHLHRETTVSEYSKVKQGSQTWTLLYSSGRIQPNALCQQQYWSFSDNNLCLLASLPAPRPMACKRDVGSPLIVTESDGKPTLLGLATAADGKATSCFTVFTKIAPHLDWISDVTHMKLRK